MSSSKIRTDDLATDAVASFARSRQFVLDFGNDCPVHTGDVLANRYALELPLGCGSYGWVFSAIDIVSTPPERVAVKVLRNEQLRHDDCFRRFVDRELALLLRVQEISPTPNVVRAVRQSIVSHEGLQLLIMEYVEGPTLAEEIVRLGAIDPRLSRPIVLGIARGLAAIHACGGVHRDLKPTNIRMRNGIIPVILDLGISKALWDTLEITAPGHVPMTPRYAAPEQLAGGKTCPATDIYALGLILWEMLVGNVPLLGSTYAETLAIRNTLPCPDLRLQKRSLPDDIAELALKCLECDPARRPSATSVANLITQPSKRTFRFSEVSNESGERKTAMTWTLLASAMYDGASCFTLVGTDVLTDGYRGDTSIESELPVLAISKIGLPNPGGQTIWYPLQTPGGAWRRTWSAGILALTAPVKGTMLTSRSVANAFCVTQCGPGFRMAEFHDGDPNLWCGWDFWGAVPIKNIRSFVATRFWVSINDQDANPWSLSSNEFVHSQI